MILRHLEGADFARVGSLPPFDGFVVGAASPADAKALRDLHPSFPAYMYVNLLEKPLAEWMAGEVTPEIMERVAWFKLVDILCPALPNVKLWHEGRRAIDWREMDQTRLHELLIALNRYTQGFGVFADQVWMEPHPWMFRSDGAPFESFPPERWTYWRRRFRRFLQSIARTLPWANSLMLNDWTGEASPAAVPVVDGELPMRYLESSERRFEQAVGWWRKGLADRCVLSVRAEYTYYVEQVISFHDQHPERWIAFTGNDPAAVDLAYEKAAG